MNCCKYSQNLVLLLSFGLALGTALWLESPSQSSQPLQEKQAESEAKQEAAMAFEPVDNMHHFMEYVYEPGYKGLKQVLAKKPEDRKAWKAFKNHALVIAESCALLAERGPEEAKKNQQWVKITHGVYQDAKALYKSAGKYDEAMKHYGVMIEKCNQCHKEFADGKYQLKK